MNNFDYLCVAHWDDPHKVDDDRVGRTAVHVYRHRVTRQLRVIRIKDEGRNPAPTYRVRENELILPAGGLPN